MKGLYASSKSLVEAALAEDVGPGDWTTQWCVDPDIVGSAEIVAKEPLVVAGVGVARLAFHGIDETLDVILPEAEGAHVESGAVVLRVRGRVAGILTAERTALNFLGRLSGIATLTREFVRQVAGTGARITDTRKTTPGWRPLEKWAVRLGGAVNHRMGLYDMVLIKDNHLAAAGGAPEAARRVASRNELGLPVEVEVTHLDQIEALRGEAVNRILLDNMSERDLREAVERISRWPTPRPELEASGNMSLDRVRSVAETGVDWISVGALTHSARAVDFSLRLSEAEGGR